MNPTFIYGDNATMAKVPGATAAVENAYHPQGQAVGEFAALEWKNGIGTLPGSDLKFRRNERGDIEVVMEGMNEVTENGGNHSIFSPLPDDGNDGQVEDLSRKTRDNRDGRLPMARWNDPETHAPTHAPNGEYFVESPIQQNQHGFINGGENQFQPTAEYNNRMNGYGPPPPLLANDQRKPEGGRLDPYHGRSDPVPQPPQFLWDKYLQEQNAVAAPESVFREITGRDPFPPPIRFVVGDLLESVDPLHQSLICAVSVVEVKGCRMRLHFDGYSTLHDFWVNANDDLIFPCGFCEKTGRKLHPPKESDPSTFQWANYARATGKTITDEGKFREDFKKCYGKNSEFGIGEKLEAIDRQNPELTCVATVTDVIDKYILIHFDGWNHNFDYWCDHTSNYIHPIGRCGNAGQTLAVPHDYLEDTFSWSDYLKETNSKAASEGSFHPRKSHGFEIGMKLEVVDKRNPILVRVASIVEKSPYRVKIHFDGWEELYDYWIDCDSTDLHPVKWCARTGHSLQPNITEEERQSWQGGCPVPGCRGLGHIKGSKFLGHHSEYGCPYSSKNLDSYPIQDRITPRRGPKPSSLMSRRMMSVTDKPSPTTDIDRKRSAGLRRTSKTSFIDVKDRSRSESRSPVGSPFGDNEPPEKRRAVETKVEGVVSDGGKNLYYSLYSSSLWSSVPNKQLAVYWEQCTRLIQGFKGIRGSRVCKWSVKEVADFVENLTGKERYGEMFLNEEIDGEAFLLLTQNDIFKVMKIKLGPTLKIHGAILYARANE